MGLGFSFGFGAGRSRFLGSFWAPFGLAAGMTSQNPPRVSIVVPFFG